MSVFYGSYEIVSYILKNIIKKSLHNKDYRISDISYDTYRHGSHIALEIKLHDNFRTIYSISYGKQVENEEKIMNKVLQEVYSIIERGAPKVQICDGCRCIIKKDSICDCKEIPSNDEEKPNGFVYFLQIEDKIKIGFANGVHPDAILKRIKQYRAAIPHPNKEIKIAKYVRGNLKKEKGFHRIFEEYNITNEWFRYEGKLKDYILTDKLEKN